MLNLENLNTASSLDFIALDTGSRLLFCSWGSPIHTSTLAEDILDANPDAANDHENGEYYRTVDNEENSS
jgi:hypothetical protein